MAFTKIAAAGIGSTETVTLHSLEVLNNATVGGVLTYEDVTNVDSVGLITARNGIVVGSGITLSKDGDIFTTGISTFGGNVQLSGTDPEIELNNGGPRFRVPSANTLTIHTGSGLGSANEERLRFTSDGNLQVPIGSDIEIGQTASSSHADGNAGSVLLGIKDGGGAMSGVKVTNVDAGTYNDQIVTFLTAQGGVSTTTERLRIKSDGTINITTANGSLEWTASSGSNPFIRSVGSGQQSLEFNTGGNERLRVASNGNITHTASSGSTILTLKRSNANTSGATGTINFAASDGHSVASMIALGDGDDEGADLSFRTTTAAASDDPYDSSIVERLRITSTGEVGINIDDPDAKLEVRDGAASGIIIRCTNTQSTDTNKAIRVRNNSDTDTFAVSHKGKVFPLDNIVMASGKGIDFTATGDGGTVNSELFDDYEEGAWTPVLNGTHSNMGTGYGKYAKIGSVTHYWIEFGQISAGNGSFNTNTYITGFPYSTPSTDQPNHWTGTSSYMNSAYGMTMLSNYYNSADQFYITQAAGSLRYFWAQVTVWNF